MSKEEKIIQRKLGRESHFTVPDNYFDQLTQQVMERLPEPETKVIPFVTPWHKFRAMAVAACSLIAVFGVGYYLLVTTPSSSHSHSMIVFDADENNSSYAWEEAADYAMLDNNDIYASLMESNY